MWTRTRNSNCREQSQQKSEVSGSRCNNVIFYEMYCKLRLLAKTSIPTHPARAPRRKLHASLKDNTGE